ncbi:hypothetical protein D9M68_426790 [compost metagenome]
MHDGQRVTVVVDDVLQSLAHQALGAFFGNRLHTDTAILIETDLGDAHLFLQELDDLVRLGRTGLPLDAGINVFGVLAEDGHVDVARLLHRARHAFEPAHRAQADVQIELLAQRHVQRANTATDRGGQRTLDGNDVVTYGFQGFFRQPGILVVDLGRFLAGVDFHPGDLALAAVGFLHGRIDDFDHYRADVDADAVAFNERDDRVVRYIQGHVGIDGDFVTGGWHLDLLVSHAGLRCSRGLTLLPRGWRDRRILGLGKAGYSCSFSTESHAFSIASSATKGAFGHLKPTSHYTHVVRLQERYKPVGAEAAIYPSSSFLRCSCRRLRCAPPKTEDSIACASRLT